MILAMDVPVIKVQSTKGIMNFLYSGSQEESESQEWCCDNLHNLGS